MNDLWTTKLPTEPGLYWLSRGSRVEMVRVDALDEINDDGDPGVRLAVFFHGSDIFDGVENVGGPDIRWRGPVAPPVQPASSEVL